MQSPEPFTSALQNALRQSQLETSGEGCPTLEEMADYVTRVLPAPRSQEILTHIETCSLCAGAVIELRAAFRPLLALETGWFGWRGPILAALGWLDAETLRGWKEYCARSPRCAARTQAMRTLLVPVRRPAPAFALGATAMLLLTLFWRHETPLPVAPSSPTAGITVEQVPKGVTAPDTPRSAEPMNAERLLERFVAPDDDQLPAVRAYWVKVRDRHPDNAGVWGILRELYTRSAAREPSRRAEWKQKAEAARQQVTLLTQKP